MCKARLMSLTLAPHISQFTNILFSFGINTTSHKISCALTSKNKDIKFHPIQLFFSRLASLSSRGNFGIIQVSETSP